MKKYLIVGLIVIAAISLTGCSTQKTSTNPSDTSVAASASPAAAETTPSTTAQTYKDGDYEAVGNYISPGGPEQIEVKVTLKDNVITDATVVSKADREESKHYQGLFIDGFKSQVIGKNINEVSLSKVSGSSLTPKGFNDALDQIRAKAKV